MTKKNRELFLEWYKHNLTRSNVFDFKKELYEYCKSDVQLLTEGCLIFRKNAIESSKFDKNDYGIDPFTEALTIASYSNLIYRRNFLPKNSIALIPERGINPKQKSSVKACLWLKFIETSKNINLQHAGSILGEFKVDKYFVDGYDRTNKTVYEFYGCYW